ncbi:MAG TPA: hypothetical protein VKO67_05980 [Smithellaceae bacterium]|nr:hypothetical protein [Smithellaceae bacterium]
MTHPDVTSTLIEASAAFDAAMRRLNPLVLSDLREELLLHIEPLQEARKFLHAGNQEDDLNKGRLRACDFLLAAIRNFANEEDLQAAYIAALRAARKHCRALEALFALCGSFPDINRYFLEKPVISDAFHQDYSLNIETGLFHIGHNQNLHARGGYSLYIPEICSPRTPAPLIVALHGGYSHGRDFLWTWLAHARSRGYILFAPTSAAMSWSIGHAATDAQVLMTHLEEVFARVPIDRSRMLLSGMSDGGTYALELALSSGSIFQYVASVACALAPFDTRQVEDKHIFWIHGAHDWIFPVSNAVNAGKQLKSAGADIRMKIIPDLSHTYPREENSVILDWFENVAGKQ